MFSPLPEIPVRNPLCQLALDLHSGMVFVPQNTALLPRYSYPSTFKTTHNFFLSTHLLSAPKSNVYVS